ncbi:hypothetical protein BDZ89DRAFT_1056551, partial [Hymenopellis radicata]
MHLTRGWVNLGPQSRSSAYTPAAADKGHVENNTDGEKLRVRTYVCAPESCED